MSNIPRPRRSSPEIEEFEGGEEDYDQGYSRQLGQEKMKQLGFDLVGRWHWIFLGLVLGILGGLYYTSKAPKLYRATATVLVKQQTATVMTKDQQDEINLGSTEGLNTVAELIRRPGLMEKVGARANVRNLPGLISPPVDWLPGWLTDWFGGPKRDFDSTPPPPAALGSRIAGWTSIEIRRGTRLLDISVSHTSPEAAMTIANAIAVEYQTERTGDRSETRASSTDILTAESEQARQRLQVAQNSLGNYQRALVTLKELEAREDQFAEISTVYKSLHPKWIAAKADLENYQKRFLAEFESARTSVADRAYWESTAEEWLRTGDNPEDQVRTARRLLQARGSVLESEIASQETVYANVIRKIQESGINIMAVEADVEIRSPAVLPGAAYSPVPSKIISTASVAGLAGGLLLALLFIRLDNKFHTVAQVERETGLPVLAAISDIPVKVLAAAVRKRKIDLESIPPARKRWDPHLVFREGVSNTTFAEAFRVLRASVSLLGDEKKRRITLFSSALPGEGKTMVSSNFALAAAQQGKRTILIDLDLRKPSVHNVFGLKRDSHVYGATEVLAGQAPFADAVFVDTGDNHLHLMLSGKQAPNPGELLNAKSLEALLEFALREYEVVVIDSAPLLAVPDTRMIIPLADNFCLVTRAEYVPKGAVRRLLSLLSADKTYPSGVIVNGFVEKRRLIGENYSYGNYQTNRYGKAYRYGYGSYGSYGSEEA